MFGFKNTKRHRGLINGLAVSPGGDRMITGAEGSGDRDGLVWKLPSLSVVGELHGHPGGIRSAAWSRSGRLVVTGANPAVPRLGIKADPFPVRLWDADSCRQSGELEVPLRSVRALAVSNDDKLLLTGGQGGEEYGLALFRLWDLQDKVELLRFGQQRTSVESVAFSPDGRLVACGCFVQFNQQRALFSGGAAQPTVYSPDPASGVRTLRLFELQGGREIEQFEYFECVNSIKFTPDGRHLLSIGKEYLLWNVDSGRQVFRFQPAESSWANSGDISADGRLVAIGCGDQIDYGRYRDCCVRVWRFEAPKEIAVFPHKRYVNRLAFVPGANLVVAAGDNAEVHIWSFEEAEIMEARGQTAI